MASGEAIPDPALTYSGDALRDAAAGENALENQVVILVVEATS